MFEFSSVLQLQVDPQFSERSVKKPISTTWFLHVLNCLIEVNTAQSRRPTFIPQFSAAAMLLMGVCLPFVALSQSPNITTPFQITGIRVQNGNTIVSWKGGGASNQLQHASNFSGPWQTLGLPTPGSRAPNRLRGPLGSFRTNPTGATRPTRALPTPPPDTSS